MSQSTGFDGSAVGDPPARRSRLLVIVIAAGALMILGLACSVSGGLYLLNRTREPSRAAAPMASPTPRPPPSPSLTATPTPKTGAPCVPGIWRETSTQVESSIGGVTVRLSSSGAIQHFFPDGSLTIDMGAGITRTGTQNGATYAVTSTGTLSYHYQVVGNQILYSDYHATGTTVWLRNGRQIDKQDLMGTIGADTFTCTGGKLVEYGDGYSIELVRVFG